MVNQESQTFQFKDKNSDPFMKICKCTCCKIYFEYFVKNVAETEENVKVR